MTSIRPDQWRQRRERNQLERYNCTECDQMFSLEHEICPVCGATEKERTNLDREGEIMTFVVQHFLPDKFDAPLPLAIVETSDGGRLFGEVLCAPEEIKIGQNVEAVLRQDADSGGSRRYDVKFRLLEDLPQSDSGPQEKEVN